MRAIISEGQHTLFAENMNPRLEKGLKELTVEHFERLLQHLKDIFKDKIRIFY